MIEPILNLSIYQWAFLYLYFLCSMLFGALLMRFYFHNVFKKISDNMIKQHQNISDNLISRFESNASDLYRRTNNLQELLMNNFEIINDSVQKISNILTELESHLIQVSTLEMEIIKLKKIIKRMEKKHEV